MLEKQSLEKPEPSPPEADIGAALAELFKQLAQTRPEMLAAGLAGVLVGEVVGRLGPRKVLKSFLRTATKAIEEERKQHDGGANSGRGPSDASAGA